MDRAERDRRRPWPGPSLYLILVASFGLGCATYVERTAQSRASVAQGSYDSAIEALNDALRVDDRNEIPSRFRAETALLLLDRAMVSQAQGQYAAAARDLEAADERLEYLDIAGDVAGSIGKYVYSDSSATYKAWPVEKLALNSLNMLNYLAVYDLSGARVEAKRFTVMYDYLREHGPAQVHGALGSYLAGFVFERLGDANAALRYYDQALAAGDFATLADPVGRLAQLTSYRGDRIAEYLRRHPARSADPYRRPTEILTVVCLGRVPVKVAERIPVGAAIGIAGTYISGDPEVLGYTATKVLVYPELTQQAPAFLGARVAVDDRPSAMELATDFGVELSAEYEQMKPQIIGAALSRMIVRAGAAEGARAAGKQAGGDAGPVLGWIAALLTEATLVAVDKPDTRSWTLLPEKALLARSVVAPGRHTVEVDLDGYQSERRVAEVEVPEDGFAVVVVTPLR